MDEKDYISYEMILKELTFNLQDRSKPKKIFWETDACNKWLILNEINDNKQIT